MANKTDFKTVENSSGDMAELEEQIRQHRRRTLGRAAAALVIFAVLFVGIQLFTALRSYSSFEVLRLTERKDSAATRYASFLGQRVEYSNDGIVYYGSGEELVWNQSFEMTSPVIDICEGYLVIYDAGGTSLYIMTESGVSKQIETSMPVSRACVANQGTVAVLMKEDAVSYVRLYDRKGTELANGEFFQKNGTFPMDIALSADAQKLAVCMADVNAGKLRSVISFYNFGSVGQNEIDNNVGTYSYDGLLIPELDYVSADRMVAFTSEGLLVFEGAQKPALKRTVEYGVEARSVFHNSKYVGITYPNSDVEGSWHIRVYDLNGSVIMENDTTLAYSQVEFLDNNEICVRDSHRCELFTVHSIHKFSYTFDEELYKVLSGSGSKNYTLVLEGVTKEVRLK
ncbi:MAG: DUF5711 family protein [Muribaculaceae bacterium]|nr:DUF5711 family protein [Roseburia sp.]MCM1432276.1 DUF5711 family protein [Muribaculaceae bacterium]MCM1494052.1 DUF5711 family protein [Muribaculaceae bacterium]